MRKELLKNEINADLPLFSISTTAKMLGISVHTLRMYERAGLILPFQKESSHRLYSHVDIERLKCIRRAINEDKISIAGIQRIHALLPCWEIVSCSHKDRKHCEAYRNFSQACWTFDHPNDTCKERECRSCPVYKESFDCTKIKNRIIEITEKYESTL